MKVGSFDDYKWFVYGTLVTGGEHFWDNYASNTGKVFKDEDDEQFVEED